MFYASFARGRSFTYSFFLSVSLLALALFITGYYHYLQDPLFHQNAYAILTAIVLLRSMYVMEVNMRPSLRKHRQVGGEKQQNGSAPEASKAEIERQDVRDKKILNKMWTLVAYGLSIFLGGFFIWNLDNWFCGTLRSWRRELGLPWGIVLEGHGWW